MQIFDFIEKFFLKNKRFLLIVVIVCLQTTFSLFSQTNENMQPITVTAADGLQITADYYPVGNSNPKVIVLCHQAGYSRGEYIETGMLLQKMGYACLALDQRSGNQVNDITNETYKRAIHRKLGVTYADAFPDLEAALEYVKDNLNPAKIMFLGSSYSSSLSIIMAAKYPNEIDAVAAYSPGNYFEIDNLTISDFALKVICPTYITSAKSESKSWKGIFENLGENIRTSFIPESKGLHGSKTLWSSTPGSKEYWASLKSFLSKNF